MKLTYYFDGKHWRVDGRDDIRLETWLELNKWLAEQKKQQEVEDLL